MHSSEPFFITVCSIVIFLFSFGVCCLFVVRSGDSLTDVTQNCTYVQNRDFPSGTADLAGTEENFLVAKSSQGGLEGIYVTCTIR